LLYAICPSQIVPLDDRLLGVESDEFNALSVSLPATATVTQWLGSHVCKAGGRVFAIGAWDERREPHVTFKFSPMAAGPFAGITRTARDSGFR
jgi:hypothetical protein